MVFKCKMCGGDIEITEQSHIGKCLYCKSTMTLPNLDDEKIVNLYNRANDLRISNEFDKAYETYETILKIDNDQVEAHFGLLLCKYGVEYIDDPKTKRKIPTCHRTISESILNDTEYKYIKKNAYGEALELYQKEVEEINNIQKRILEISAKEEPYDIFICYKETDENNERTHDSVIAQDIYEALTKEGYKVFFSRITLEDKLGVEYEPYIFSALKSAKVMLAIGTKIEHYNAVWVKNEWCRYLEFMKNDRSKTIIPVYSKMDAYKLPEEFVMLQAQSMDKVGAMQDLVRGIKKIIDASKDKGSIDDDVLKKVKAALDEESSLGNDKYEVTEVKEKLPTWYYVLVVTMTVFLIIFKLISFEIGYVVNIASYNRHVGISDLPLIFNMLQVINCLLVTVALVMKLKSRRSYQLANYLYFIFLIIEVISGLGALRQGAVIYLGWLSTAGLAFILYLVNPKWHIDSSSKAIVNKEQKQKIEQKNKKIKDEFTYKSKYVISLKMFFISAFICIVIYGVFAFVKVTTPNENGRDSSVPQIEIISEEVVLLNGMKYFMSSAIDTAYEGEIYTIIDTIRKSNNDSCLLWYQIKTGRGANAYICGQDEEVTYVKELPIESN